MASLGPTWRRPPPLAVDSILALALTVYVQAAGGWFVEPEGGFAGSPLRDAVSLLITVPLAWRRRRPVAVFSLVVAGIIITFTSGITAHPSLVWGAIVALLIAAYSVGAYSGHQPLALAALLAIATAVVIAFRGGVPPLPDFVAPYAILIPPWLGGHAIRGRQGQVEAYRERASRLDRERELATRVALYGGTLEAGPRLERGYAVRAHLPLTESGP